MINSTMLFNDDVVTVLEVLGEDGLKCRIRASNGRIKRINTCNLKPLVTTEDKPKEVINMLDPILDELLSVSTVEQENLIQLAVKEILEEAKMDLEESVSREFKRASSIALVFCRAVTLYNAALKSEDLILTNQVLRAVLEFTRGWKYTFRVNSTYRVLTEVSSTEEYYSNRKTNQAYYFDTLNYMNEKSSGKLTSLIGLFNEGVENILNKYRILTDEEIDTGFRKKSLALRNKELTLVPENNEPVQLTIRRGGILLNVKKDTAITFSNGATVVIPRAQRYGLDINLVNKNISKVLESIYIHPKTENVDYFGNTVVGYNSETIEVNGSPLNKLFLLKFYRVDISKVEQGLKKIVSLDSYKGLEEIAYPTSELPNVYGGYGITSTPEAEAGYVGVRKDVPCLLAYVGDNVITVNALNKTIARFDKLEKDAFLIGTHRAFVAIDATSDEAFKLLGAGASIFPASFIRKYGLCRITSRMMHGGLKTTTNYLPGNEHIVISPSALKGGLLGLLALRGYDVVRNLVNVYGMQEKLNLAVERLHENAEVLEVGGVELKGLWVDIPLNITNCYTIENYYYPVVGGNEVLAVDQTVEESIQRGSELLDGYSSTGLRSVLMSRVVDDPDFEIVPYLMKAVETGEVLEKKAVTRHTASIFQTLAYWHGETKARRLVDSLIHGRLYGRDKVNKVLANEFLRGVHTKDTTINLKEVAEILIQNSKAFEMVLLDGVDTYPLNVLTEVLTLVGYREKEDYSEGEEYINYVGVNCSGYLTHVPIRFGAFFSEANLNTGHGSFTATGYLRELLMAAKRCIDLKEDATTNFDYRYVERASYISGQFLEAAIQKQLLGKNYGYLPTIGAYQVILNDLGGFIKNGHGVGVTDINMFMTRREQDEGYDSYIRVNGCKHPAYFEDACAGYEMSEIDFEDDVLNFAMKKAAFLRIDTVMIMENDCDGDLHQFTNDGFNLPLFKGPAHTFNGIEFRNFIKDEQEGCKVGPAKVERNTTAALHVALTAAGTAKANIGLYTDIKFKYEILVRSVKDVRHGPFVTTISQEEREMVIATLARLCQVEAMDNIKQTAGVSRPIMDRISIHSMTTFKETATQTMEQVREAHYSALSASFKALFSKGWDVPHDFDRTIVQILARAAYSAKAIITDKSSFCILSNRATGPKRLEEIYSNLSGENDSPSSVYRFAGCVNHGLYDEDIGLYSYVVQSILSVR